MAAYSKIIAAFMKQVERQEQVRPIYIVERFAPPDNFEEESPPPPDPADVAPFPAEMRACFESLQLDGLPKFTLVSGHDDPDIARESTVSGGASPDEEWPDVQGVVLELSRIPGTQKTADVAISAYYGFDNMEGATYRANESDYGWNIMMREQWIT